MARVPQSFQQVPMPGGATPIIESFPEAASQTFKAGDLVTKSSGKVAVWATDGAAILGVARQDASGVTSARVLVEIIRPGVMYQGNLRLASDTFVEGTDNDTLYGLVATGAGNVEIDKSDTSNTRVCVIDTLEKSPDGKVLATQGGPVKIFFKAANLEATA